MGIFDYFKKNKRKAQQDEQCLTDVEEAGEADFMVRSLCSRASML